MKWLVLWLLLTGIYLLGLLVSQPLADRPWEPTRETVAHLVAIPLAEVAALRLLTWLRQAFRQGKSAPPSP